MFCRHGNVKTLFNIVNVPHPETSTLQRQGMQGVAPLEGPYRLWAPADALEQWIFLSGSCWTAVHEKVTHTDVTTVCGDVNFPYVHGIAMPQCRPVPQASQPLLQGRRLHQKPSRGTSETEVSRGRNLSPRQGTEVRTNCPDFVFGSPWNVPNAI